MASRDLRPSSGAKMCFLGPDPGAPRPGQTRLPDPARASREEGSRASDFIRELPGLVRHSREEGPGLLVRSKIWPVFVRTMARRVLYFI